MLNLDLGDEWPCIINHLGVRIMEEENCDAEHWREERAYYLSYETQTQLWTLNVTSKKINDENSSREKEGSEESFGPFSLQELKDLLSTYDFILTDQHANKLVDKLKTKPPS